MLKINYLYFLIDFPKYKKFVPVSWRNNFDPCEIGGIAANDRAWRCWDI